MNKLVSILIGLTLANSFGATFTAASAARADVATAYASATHGDTIEVPAGSATWSSSLPWDKALTIKTLGTVTLTAGATLATGFFYTSSLSNTNLYRITGFTFNSVNLASGSHAIMILGSVDLPNTRIDHNIFHHGDIQTEFGGCKGVVDHNKFYNGISAVYYTAGTRAQADASWATMAAGTGEALFFEDNEFTHDANFLTTANNACFDTYNGGKLVIRYNSFLATNDLSWTGTYGVLELHGSAGGGASVAYWQADSNARRGQSIVEMYNNSVKANRVDFLAKLRGSSNLIFSNTLDTASFTPRLIAYEEEWYETQWSPLRVDWPGEDQVHNSFFWANTLRLNGVVNTNYFESGSSTNFIQEGRDFVMHAPEASGGREIFTGANGAAGTHPTDGSPYATAGTMQRQEGVANAYYPYTPYVYPHPLTVIASQRYGKVATRKGRK